MERRFTGFFIPVDIIEHSKLNWTDRIVLVEIDALNINNNGCFANNKHFCELLEVDSRTIQRSIAKLESLGLIIIKNGASKNRRIFTVNEIKQPRQKCHGNPDKNVIVTQTPLSGSHINITEITNESLPLPPHRGREREIFESKKTDFTDPAIDVNFHKTEITIDVKKQRLNNLVEAFTNQSDFIEFMARRLKLDGNEIKKLLKKFLDTIAADDTCYDDFSLLRRRATAYIVKTKEKAA